MNSMVEEMIKAYEPKNLAEQKNAMKEVMQEIILCGLSRAGFFQKAAFYGGTALRIFYGLDRFSEDMEFSLMAENDAFALESYFPQLEQEVRSFGLNIVINAKQKTKDSKVASAFLKGNTKEHLLLFYPGDSEFSSVPKDKLIKIKFEVDTNPPAFATYERRFRLQPIPYEVNIYDAPSLFAGKIHAVIGRAWKTRTKGRDLYDYIFYLSRGIPVNLNHLTARLIQSGHLEAGKKYSVEEIRDLLRERFKEIDYEQAKSDVEPFLEDSAGVNLWSEEFFSQITEKLRAAENN